MAKEKEENVIVITGTTTKEQIGDKRIDLDSFISLYKKAAATKVEASVDQVMKKLTFRDYVPYAEKITLCTNIVKSTSYEYKDSEPIKMCVNTPARFCLFELTLVNTYTNLQIDFTRGTECFDKLNQANLFEKIRQYIDAKEYDEFNVVLHMVVDDFDANNKNTMAYLERLVNTTMETFKLIIPDIESYLQKQTDKTNKPLSEGEQ